MKLLSSFKQLRLYRNKVYMLDPYDKKVLSKSTFVMVLSPLRDDMVKFFNSKMIYMLYLRGFFSEKRIRVKLVNGTMRTMMQKLNEVYDAIKEQMPYIRFTFLNAAQYANKNVIYDASNLLTILQNFTASSVLMYLRQAYAIFDMLVTNAKFQEYGKKYVIVPIDGNIKLDNASLMKTRIRTISQAFLFRLLVEHETMSSWIGITIIITNTKGMFLHVTITEEIVLSGLKDAVRFRMLIKTLWAFAAGDAESMLECDGFIEANDDTIADTSNSIDNKITKIAKKLSTNDALSIDDIKSNIVASIEDPVEPVKPEDPLDKTISALNAIQNPRHTKSKKNTESHKTIDILYDEIVTDTDELTSDDDSENKEDEDSTEKSPPDVLHDDSESEPPSDIIDPDADETSTDTYDESKNEKDLYEQTPDDVLKTVNTSQMTIKEIRRIKLLNKKFDKLSLNMSETETPLTFKELIEEYNDTKLDIEEIPIKVTNKSIRYNTTQAFNRTYYKKKMDADIVKILDTFRELPDLKMIVKSAHKKDTSDALTATYEYSFRLEDEHGKSHTMTYDIPKLVDNKFFLINGNKKSLDGQILPLPVLKIGPNKVRISAFNQMELYRFGKSFDSRIDVVKKFLDKCANTKVSYGITHKLGNSLDINSKYMTTLEYDEYSKTIYTITIKSHDKKSVSFVFNQKDFRTMMEDLDIEYIEKPGLCPICIDDTKKIGYININTGKDNIEDKYTISELIINAIIKYAQMEHAEAVIKKIAVPKKHMYTRMHYLDRLLSFGVFLGYLYGLTALLKKTGVVYAIRKDKLTNIEKHNLSRNTIQFSDCYLDYDVNPTRHSLLLNGIGSEVDCLNYTIADMDTETPYLHTFESLFKTTHMAKGYKTCQIWMLDPFSVRVLKDLGLPYEFFEVMLYANSLLEDNSCVDPKTTAVNRIRKYELIPYFMYQSMARSYLDYKYRYGKKGTMSVKRNDIIARLKDSHLCNDYDTLNPIRELESEGTVTFKGPGGCNVTDAYSLSRRAYDKSMVGIFAASTPDGPSVGITKYLTLNPRIKNITGLMKSGSTDDIKDVDFGNMGSVAELLVPNAIDHDDAKRLGMVGKESKHMMVPNESDPILIGNGVEKVVPYMVSNDFISIAKNNGKVLAVDKELGLAIVEYSDGVKESVDIVDRAHKDGGMGFYIVSKKQFNFKEGDAFKKNDVLAMNPGYFSTVKGKGAPEFTLGVLANVAIIMSYTTYEDSSIIFERIGTKLSTEVVFCKQIVIGAKTTVHKIVSAGEPITAGDPLMVYEDELEDAEVADVLSNANISSMSHLEDIIKHIPKSKNTGTIHDVKVHYTVPISDMSDSVKAIVVRYNNKINARKKYIDSFESQAPGDIIIDYVGVSKPDSLSKLNGAYCPTGKVLIEIYTKYRDFPGAGDKVVYYAAMKTVLHRQYPQSMAPYPLGRKNDSIDAILSPISIEARMVTCIFYAMYGNKCIMALKERIRDMYNVYATIERKSASSKANLIESTDAESYIDSLFTNPINLIELYKDTTITIEETQSYAKSKCLYICLYMPSNSGFFRDMLTKGIILFTKSLYTHSAIGLHSDGTFYSLGCSSVDDMKDMNTALKRENLNTMANLHDPNMKYDVYALECTTIEYDRATALLNKYIHSGNFKYDFKTLIRIAVNIFFKGHKPKVPEGFNSQQLLNNALVCSGFVCNVLCLSVISLVKWFSTQSFGPALMEPYNITKIPGIRHLFTASATVKYDLWKKEYERTHGALPN